jgi:uncharacterized protein (TIGR02996 family)
MVEEQSFIKAILENPDKGGPRLDYAEWLREQSDGPTPQLIRFLHEKFCTLLPSLPLWLSRQNAVTQMQVNCILSAQVTSGSRTPQAAVAQKLLACMPRDRLLSLGTQEEQYDQYAFATLLLHALDLPMTNSSGHLGIDDINGQQHTLPTFKEFQRSMQAKQATHPDLLLEGRALIIPRGLPLDTLFDRFVTWAEANPSLLDPFDNREDRSSPHPIPLSRPGEAQPGEGYTNADLRYFPTNFDDPKSALTKAACLSANPENALAIRVIPPSSLAEVAPLRSMPAQTQRSRILTKGLEPFTIEDLLLFYADSVQRGMMPDRYTLTRCIGNVFAASPPKVPNGYWVSLCRKWGFFGGLGYADAVSGARGSW